MKRVAVIGAGPAGMMAAASAAFAGAQTVLLEKNEKPGKKLYITGKGRCNLTNACEVQDFFDNIVSNPRFAYSAVYGFSNKDTISFFEHEGLALKTERGARVFPVSDKASDVTKTLESCLRRAGAKVSLGTEVLRIVPAGGGFLLETASGGERRSITADAVIIATGGLSYPSTGSDGAGYAFARELGHSIKEPVPSLVPLTAAEGFVKELEGLSLKNVRVSLSDSRGRVLFSDFGEMLFTSCGVSGPLILSASCYVSGRLAGGKEKLSLSVDLKPALEPARLDARILRDFEKNKNRDFKNSLGGLLPSKLIPVIVGLSTVNPEKKVNSVTKEERTRLVRLLKSFTLTVTGTGGFSQAIVTQGGVNVKEVNPGTMESGKMPGIYFAGEVLDLDGVTGGFNIQLALSTGRLAGISAAQNKE